MNRLIGVDRFALQRPQTGVLVLCGAARIVQGGGDLPRLAVLINKHHPDARLNVPVKNNLRHLTHGRCFSTDNCYGRHVNL